jgi:hypothetical protein
MTKIKIPTELIPVRLVSNINDMEKRGASEANIFKGKNRCNLKFVHILCDVTAVASPPLKPKRRRSHTANSKFIAHM